MKLDIVIPVLNEERGLSRSIDAIIKYCDENLPSWNYRVVIADNGSTDGTPEIGQFLAVEHQVVSYVRIHQKGRGRALKQVWSVSKSDIVAYMDVDLSTDLEALPRALYQVTERKMDICVGSRLLSKSIVENRSFYRGFISRCYSLLFRLLFFVSFRDAQCGFKVVLKSSLDDVLEHVRDSGWFFDTELLILFEKSGFKVSEIPVVWVDDPNSKVNVMKTAWGDLKGLFRLRFGGLSVCKKIISNRSQT